MARRTAIGATMAAAVIFSVILASNFAVFFASQDRARLYFQANAEDALADEALALAGAAGTNLLERVQTFVDSRIFNCSQASGVISTAVGQLNDSRTAMNVTVDAFASMTPSAAAGDNLTMLAPFNGSSYGALDVSFEAHMSGSTGSDFASYSKKENHLMHLPVKMDAAVADCLGAAQGIEMGVSSSLAPNCALPEIGPLITTFVRGPAALASTDGFMFGLRFNVTSSSPCTVRYLVSIEQGSIPGPGGEFRVRMQEGGLASFEE